MGSSVGPPPQNSRSAGRTWFLTKNEGDMILAGDIGGTKTILALFDWKTERVEPARERTFASADFKSLEEILEEFLKPPPKTATLSGDETAAEASELDESGEAPPIMTACFGVAGPVIENRSRTTNLPWVVDGTELAARFKIQTVRLLNDWEATAHGMLVLRPDDTEILNVASPPPTKGAMALIAAGTGLGEAILFWDGV